MFLVQPMVAKQLLPILGGSPAVWNSAMVFFQASLLAGYLYAHGLTRLRSRRLQVAVHAGAILAAILLLPIGVPDSLRPSPESSPVAWLLGTLTFAIGGPFFVLSATAPLFQSWFARTDHPRARDPYFLYAASNAGSLIALLGYPLLLEPAASLSSQRQLWSYGFAGFALLAAACALSWLRSPRTVAVDASGARQTNSEPAYPIDRGCAGSPWPLFPRP